MPPPQLEEAVQASSLLVTTGRKSFSQVLGCIEIVLIVDKDSQVLTAEQDALEIGLNILFSSKTRKTFSLPVV